MNKYITLFSLGLLAISCTSKTDQSKFYYDMAAVYGESVYWPDTSNARILKDNYSDLNNAQFIDKLYELMGDSEGQIHAFVLIYSDRTQRKINYAVAKAFNHPYDKSTSSTGQQVYTTVTYLSEANSSVTPTPVGMTKKELIAENPKQNIKTESIPEELLDFITDKNKQLFVRDKKIIGLNLEGKKITNQLLVSILKFDELEFLVLDSTKVTDEGLKHIAKLTKLRALWLDFNDITGVGLNDLASLENLEDLDIEGINITDNNGLKSLANLSSVRSLEIINNGIGDECIESIKKMKRLEDLWLIEGNEFSSEGLKSLKKDLPNCKIH